MLMGLRLGALLAHAPDLEAEFLDPKAGRQSPAQLHRLEPLFVQIRDRSATGANKMMMGMGIGIDAPAMMHG